MRNNVCVKYAWQLKRILIQSKVKKHTLFNILDVGCGSDPESGLFKYITNKSKIALGLDINKNQLRKAKSQLKSARKLSLEIVEFIRASANYLPFRKEFFDAIVSCEVIEHLQSPETFLSECNRISKNGGIIILSTPNSFTLSKFIGRFLGLFKQTRRFSIDPLHVHEFNHFELIKLLRTQNFYFLELDFGVLNPYYFPFCKNENLSQKENSTIFILFKFLNNFFSRHFLLELLFKWDFIIQARKLPVCK